MKRPVFLLFVNLFIGLYFIFNHLGFLSQSTLAGVFNELMSIPFLIALVISTIISFREFMQNGIRNGFFYFLAFLAGAGMTLVLILLTFTFN